jgi:5-methylcytosine-specific restriction enzyme subunit McrC
MVPIQNLYYLYCYAWELAGEEGFEPVKLEANPGVKAWLASVFIRQGKKLLRRGWKSGYVEKEASLGQVRGRIDWRKSRPASGKLHCQFDELSADSLENQVLMACLQDMAVCQELPKILRRQAARLARALPPTAPIRLQTDHWESLRRKNLPFPYGPLCHLAALWHHAQLPTEQVGKTWFERLPQDAESMARLFEAFVRNFYRLECREFRVGREHIPWAAEAQQAAGAALLPRMETDVSLISASNKIIIETKYYPEALRENRFGGKKFRPPHLYQLFAYLKNAEGKSPLGKHATGLLLYPTSGPSRRYDFQMEGHLVSVCSLSLNQPWQKIQQDLLGWVGG